MHSRRRVTNRYCVSAMISRRHRYPCSATLGSERFAREIAVAARLQHPHILGLLDSGEVDGFFYHVMPFQPKIARAFESLQRPDSAIAAYEAYLRSTNPEQLFTDARKLTRDPRRPVNSA